MHIVIMILIKEIVNFRFPDFVVRLFRFTLNRAAERVLIIWQNFVTRKTFLEAQQKNTEYRIYITDRR